jgi:hypothetical protein
MRREGGQGREQARSADACSSVRRGLRCPQPQDSPLLPPQPFHHPHSRAAHGEDGGGRRAGMGWRRAGRGRRQRRSDGGRRGTAQNERRAGEETQQARPRSVAAAGHGEAQLKEGVDGRSTGRCSKPLALSRCASAVCGEACGERACPLWRRRRQPRCSATEARSAARREGGREGRWRCGGRAEASGGQ